MSKITVAVLLLNLYSLNAEKTSYITQMPIPNKNENIKVSDWSNAFISHILLKYFREKSRAGIFVCVN